MTTFTFTDDQLAAIQARVDAITSAANNPSQQSIQMMTVNGAEYDLLAHGFTDLRDLLAEVARLKALHDELRLTIIELDAWLSPITMSGYKTPENVARCIQTLKALVGEGSE